LHATCGFWAVWSIRRVVRHQFWGKQAGLGEFQESESFSKEEAIMTKADLVSKIADDAGVTKATAEKALNSFLDAVTDALSKGDKVTLVGFGTFSVAERAQREGRNPRTGATLVIKASKVAKFKPGNKMKESIK
jgi:DNA-binding protein HU-beta